MAYSLDCAARQISVTVEYTLVPGEFYLRKRIMITSARPVTLERIDVEALGLPDAYQPYTVREITAKAPGKWSPGLGQPLYGSKSATFWGVEFPAADNQVKEGLLLAGFLWGREIQTSKPYTFKLDRAFGLFPEGGMFHVSSPIEGSTRGLPEVVYYGGTLTLAMEPHEIRARNFNVQPKEWSALKRLQGRTDEDFKPEPVPVAVPIAAHPVLGVWEYVSDGGAYTREFTREGLCLLRQGDTLVWMKPFTASGSNALVVEGRYRHALKPDGTLLIEGRHTAKRVRSGQQ